jgi:hypothetical protein
MTCPGSVVLSDGMPEKTSVFAEEGTAAHELAELLLSKTPGTMDVPAGMLDHVKVYVDHVQSLGGELHIEKRVRINDDVYGTADAVVWQPQESHLHIVDLKYGAGVPVEVDGNLQLKIYALAALLTFGYLVRRVTATIVQPRCPHSDGPIRSVTFDAVDLMDFHADIEDAVSRVVKAIGHGGDVTEPAWSDANLQPSEKGCRWCLAAPKCPALKSSAQRIAKQVFAPGVAYDPEALAETLDFLSILEGWIKNTREFAYSEAEKGRAIPNWKLVEKRATRKWRDDGVVAQALSTVVDPTFLYERKLITPAAAEKLLAKDQRGLLDELCVKESSGHTLVHESDKRPAVQVDAKSAFANL